MYLAPVGELVRVVKFHTPNVGEPFANLTNKISEHNLIPYGETCKVLKPSAIPVETAKPAVVNPIFNYFG